MPSGELQEESYKNIYIYIYILHSDNNYYNMIINFFLLFIGASTFPGLRKFIADRSKTRVLALLHIAAHGLASAGCTGWGTIASFKYLYSFKFLQ